jgi:hypothetical protein
MTGNELDFNERRQKKNMKTKEDDSIKTDAFFEEDDSDF